MTAIRLIAGLGNPSPQYDRTRHNVGAAWVRGLALRHNLVLSNESKFKGEIGRGLVAGNDVRLLVPSTYMNLSGESVGAVAHFYKISAEEILVAYDEMAFNPGLMRLKSGGGDNGHNGLKSVRGGLGSNGEFHRLRIGVGHPGEKALVTAFLTQVKMPSAESALIEQSLDIPDTVMHSILTCDWQSAMNVVHTSPSESGEQ